MASQEEREELRQRALDLLKELDRKNQQTIEDIQAHAERLENRRSSMVALTDEIIACLEALDDG